MITPSEIELLRNLANSNADAHIDMCRPRVLVLTRAVAASYSNVGAPETVLSYQFSDGLGGSGLIRGDLLRGRVFGTYASDTGGAPTDATLTVNANSTELASVTINRADLGGDVIAFDCEFVLRFDGGESVTINSPMKAPSSRAYAVLNARFGDTATSTTSRSQALADAWITATNVGGFGVNLAIPVTVTLKYEGTAGGLLTIYGGMLEGL